jgi:uronate dehydrogenase
MKIAVTGAAGVVGRPLCSNLAADHEVVAIDLAGTPTVADVRDLAALERAFEGCEAVVHLAAICDVEATWEQVRDVNIDGTYNAFEAARRAGVKRVIFASSNHAVGMHEAEGGRALYRPGAGTVVRGLEQPYRADSLYGAGKAFGEVLGRYYSDRFGLQVACVRIGSILAGDRPDDPSLRAPAFLPHLRDDDAAARYAATWMSQRDFTRLVRAILEHDVPFAVVYGVSANATRFWDLEPGRAYYGFWPADGTASAPSASRAVRSDTA